ncbi:fructose-bisphosphatase class III, partial [Intestinibaculum porci]|uniref:fructose-bisphosphatase class III n=1 Tax=Intestinibaculum porci TaxID=2487118 RepID=UPI0024094C4A
VVETLEGPYSGKALMDYFEKKARQAYFSQDVYATDIFYYLWCAPDSPLFGKDKMSTFEHCLIADPTTHAERYNAYYSLSKQEEYADLILKEFGIDPQTGHIVNGHVPVKVKKGEKPIRAHGKVFVIDGGISKAYHSKTGIAGYTLIFNSHHLALAEHHDFVRGGDNTPSIEVVEYMHHRLRVAETDNGAALRSQIRDLLELVEAYKSGVIKEHQLETDLSYTTLP